MALYCVLGAQRVALVGSGDSEGQVREVKEGLGTSSGFWLRECRLIYAGSIPLFEIRKQKRIMFYS